MGQDLSTHGGALDEDGLRTLRHDLRTPVNHIMGYSELLLEDAEDAGDEALAGPLRKIHECGKQLLALINQGLDSGKLEPSGASLPILREALQARLALVMQTLDLLSTRAGQQDAGELAADLLKIRTAAKRLDDLSSSLLIPFAPAAEPAGELRLQASSTGLILVVDDLEENRLPLASGLESQGYQVLLAEDGQQALGLLSQHPVDLLLLDMIMPQMDGITLLARLKSDPRLRHIPVIMISSLDAIEGIIRCIEMGAEDYLARPFNPVLLRARISAALEKKRMRDQEMRYLHDVALLTDAAAALESGSFQAESLAELAGRADELGRLARIMRSVASRFYTRELELRRLLDSLRIELDPAMQAGQIAQITDQEYFQLLQQKARELRGR